ncbi:2566_t:CDS:2, partial [Scutellospora calospora]
NKNKYEESEDGYEEENEYEDNNNEHMQAIKKQRTSLSTSTSIQSETLELQEIHSNIISNCLILSVISCSSNLDKIEIYPEKCKARLKNQTKTAMIEPVNINHIRKLIKTIKFPKFEPIDLEEAINRPVSPLSFLINYQTSENNILKGNKLKVAKLYSDFRLLEKGLPVVAPFFDPNSGVHKSEYYKELIEQLKIIVIQASTTILTTFHCSLVKGALDLDSYLESYFKQNNSEEPKLIQEQIISLRKTPSVFNEQLLNNKTKTIEEQLELSNNLMSKCYTSINNLDVLTYTSEVSRRTSLRKLFEFQQSYVYLKEWIGILANWQKGTKAVSQ